MGILCLVRHGQSEGNVAGVYSGTTDHLLSFNGVDQAEIAGMKLAKYQFDGIFTSNKTRAIATAQLILNYNLTGCNFWHRTDLLNERNYGVVENATPESLYKKFGGAVVKSWSATMNSAPPNGETLFVMHKRVMQFYEKELIDNLIDSNILVVSHSNIMKSLITIIEELPISELPKITVKNAEPIIYEF